MTELTVVVYRSTNSDFIKKELLYRYFSETLLKFPVAFFTLYVIKNMLVLIDVLWTQLQQIKICSKLSVKNIGSETDKN